MVLKSLMLCLTTFLALTHTIPVANAQWTINWWQEATKCQDNPDSSSYGTGTTECLGVPFPPKSFEFINTEDPVLNIRMCLNQECEDCQTLGPDVCWSLQQNGIEGVTYQIVTA